MEDLSNNTEVIVQVEFILSKAIRYKDASGYQVDLITKHDIIADSPDHPVTVYKDPVRGYRGNFYHDYDSIKDQHDFSGSARATLFRNTAEGVLQTQHNALFSIRNIEVKYEQGSFTLMPHHNTLISIAIS